MILSGYITFWADWPIFLKLALTMTTIIREIGLLIFAVLSKTHNLQVGNSFTKNVFLSLWISIFNYSISPLDLNKLENPQI